MMNILIFAGTSNGRALATSLAKKGYKITVSSMSAHGNRLIPKDFGIEGIYGKMTSKGIVDYVRKHHIDLVIDATHPYAVDISRHIIESTEVVDIPMIRYERRSSIDREVGKHFMSYEEACRYLSEKEGKVWFTTGVNHIDRIVRWLERSRILVRILPVQSSLDKAYRCGLRQEQIIAVHPPYTLEDNLKLIHHYRIKYLVTKDSGFEGGTREKLEAVKHTGIELVVIDRPVMNYKICLYTEEDIIGYVETLYAL